MRLAAKTLTALTVAAALALAGCGGDDDSATTTGTGGGAATVRTDDLSPQQQKRLEQLRERAEQKEQKQPARAVPFREPTGPAPTSSASLPNEGEKSVTPGVPTTKGGDNSIQMSGVEGPAAERVQAAKVAKAYFDARAAGEWARACSYLMEPLERQLLAFGDQARGRELDCAAVMRAFTARVPDRVLREAADIRVISLRVNGDGAFLLYRDGTGEAMVLAMGREDGFWKVGAIAGNALILRF